MVSTTVQTVQVFSSSDLASEENIDKICLSYEQPRQGYMLLPCHWVNTANIYMLLILGKDSTFLCQNIFFITPEYGKRSLYKFRYVLFTLSDYIITMLYEWYEFSMK